MAVTAMLAIKRAATGRTGYKIVPVTIVHMIDGHLMLAIGLMQLMRVGSHCKELQ